ncbi:Putative extracellular membrane protein, CFEM [Septoria linicola]|uniref:Extracellular membrane protein, CFEM n=1 Tax=Septoria linicola TaxID=215465 RepID=A0A9Q9AUF2_9PEZI|nr:putative extracellular membrane protein, CFEM [Septoria linicola]USW55609.1 Putative extracellular membrane protein, CFEM [Septoria linicola]
MAILKYAIVLLPVLVRTFPQSTIDDIPTCAYPPLLSALSGTSCAQTDISCICAQTGLIPTITSTVVEACPGSVSADDVAAFIAELCGGSAASSASSPVAESVTSAASTSGSTSLPPTSANKTSTGVSTTTNGTSTSRSTITPTTQPSDGGAEGLRMSLMAGVVAFGGLTWAFAEL